MNTFIAVDIGGTQLRAASYSSHQLKHHKINKISTQNTDLPQAGNTPMERLKYLIASIWPVDEPVAAIGVAAPGPLDPFKGIILDAPNIHGWEEFPMRQQLEDHFKVPVALGNDANLAALGEWKFGAGQGHHHLVYLTVSTGIGGGVIVDDKLLLGRQGLAAELGHVTVVPDGPMCGCGQRGHLEAIASGTGIQRWVQEQLASGVTSSLAGFQPLKGKNITQAAQQGDALAVSALARAGSFIGLAVANYLQIFNPSIVIIGGGVSQAGHFLLDPMWASIQERAMNAYYYRDLILTTAALGDEAGLMGALALAHTLSPG